MIKMIDCVRYILFATLLLASGGNALATTPSDHVKVVYHINEGLEKAADLLRNVRNHLNADPSAKIVVVGHSKGIDFMLDGAVDNNGLPFRTTMEDLADKGVEFRVCNNTLTSRHIPASKVVAPATIVPSGVAEIAKLESKGYVYLKP
ncbi:MAG: DsrE family protein [Betaproteobacteria bacterium]|nr:DsrE family protein [Betaproteobacteria bacterium]